MVRTGFRWKGSLHANWPRNGQGAVAGWPFDQFRNCPLLTARQAARGPTETVGNQSVHGHLRTINIAT